MGDAKAIQNYFVRMQKKNSEFYYVIDVNYKSRLWNAFWTDARYRVAYEYFGETITYDCWIVIPCVEVGGAWQKQGCVETCSVRRVVLDVEVSKHVAWNRIST